MTKAILIAGPTASGKSAAALTLAAGLRGTIINADSMQVYRELRVLTARPDAAALASAPHCLYGTVPARDPYSVGHWLTDAARAIAQSQDEGRVPILVGGTGLYFKALLEGLAPVPEIPPETRQKWRQAAASGTPRDLHGELAARDPAMAARLEASDPQRLVRALEVIDATGVSLTAWQGERTRPVLRPDETRRLVVAPERDTVYAAVEARFDRMLEEGALHEVEALLALDLDEGLPVMRAHGVGELIAYLSGALSMDEAVAKAKTESRRYAKRQMTWLKRFMADWDWFPDGTTAADAAACPVTSNSDPRW